MATRLYVGGLGERVTEQDLRTTFSHLGSIETIDIIRTKGRSFAYINFLPSSDNSLAKLFSTYNGCSWKGGKLKLEKAKEHYTDRLKREWAEDAELKNSEDVNHSDVDENIATSLDPKSTLDFEKMQLRMFFPKLSKVKSLPLCGTGKHKYSFQRVEVPPLPVHFCDCPEHCNDIQSGKINNDTDNRKNSVMDRAPSKGISLTKSSKQPFRGAQLDDSRIQDDGINEEEIQVMNSVMKRLLDRETAKGEPKDHHDSPQMTSPTSEVQVDKDEINEETDDDDGDDIKINTGAGPNVVSESWETSLVNKMLKSNEQRASDESAKSKLGAQNIKVKSSIKKRKSVSHDSNENDPASDIPKKKVHFQSQSKESEEPLRLTSVTESEPKKSITTGMWSQKSSWKELVGEGSSGSFSLSSGGVTNNDEKPISVKEISSDSKKHKIIRNEVIKPTNKTLSDSNEVDKVIDSVHENLDVQSKDKGELQVAQATAGPSAELSESAKGSCWMQKSPWTQLIGEGTSFSISQVLPRDVQETQKQNNSAVIVNNFYSSGAGFGGTQSSRSGPAGEDKKKNARASAARGINLSKASKSNNYPDPTSSKKSDLVQKASDILPGVGISETCPFMRSAESLKDWQTAKAALTSSLKRRNNNKQGSAS